MRPALAAGFSATVPPGTPPTRDLMSQFQRKLRAWVPVPGQCQSFLVSQAPGSLWGARGWPFDPDRNSGQEADVVVAYPQGESPAELCHLAPGKSQGHPRPQTRGCQQEIISEKSFLRPLGKVRCLPRGGPLPLPHPPSSITYRILLAEATSLLHMRSRSAAPPLPPTVWS